MRKPDDERTKRSQKTSYHLTQWFPAPDQSVSELGPGAVVLQQSDNGGGRAGGPAQPTKLGHALPVLADDARQPDFFKLRASVCRADSFTLDAR